MAKKRHLPSADKGDAAEALDSLNADLRRKSNQVIRSVEADLEKKSKRRRTSQAPASSAWKRGLA